MLLRQSCQVDGAEAVCWDGPTCVCTCACPQQSHGGEDLQMQTCIIVQSLMITWFGQGWCQFGMPQTACIGQGCEDDHMCSMTMKHHDPARLQQHCHTCSMCITARLFG